MVKHKHGQQASEAYLAFIDIVSIGKTSLVWDAEHGCWQFRWDGQVGGEWLHLLETLTDEQFGCWGMKPQVFGRYLAELWQRQMERLRTEQKNKEPV